MKSTFDFDDELHGVIEALQSSNREKQIIIDDLLAKGIEKDKKIAILEQRMKETLRVWRHLKGK